MNTFLGSNNRELELVHALADSFQLTDSINKTASVAESTVLPEPMSSLASVVETLVKCADALDGAGESTDKVDNVLSFIEKEFFSTSAAE